MRQKITSVAILAAMVLMGFVAVFGGQTAAASTYYLVEVPYEWDTDYGSGLGLSDDDEAYVSMGFAFTLYTYTTSYISISSNGWIKMGYDSYMTYYNYPMGQYYYDADHAIMPFWDDLNPSAGGDVYFYTDSTKAVITWMNVPHYYSTGTHTFQCVIRADNTFQFNYQTIVPACPNYYSSPTVGVVQYNNNVDYNQFYYTNGYTEIGTRVTNGMSVGLGAPAPRVETYREDFESGAPGWGSWGVWPMGLWHITQHRYTSPTHSMYYGRENYWDYDTGYRTYGIVSSPWIDIEGPNSEFSFSTFVRTEGGTYYDRCLVYMETNYAGIAYLKYQVLSPATWDTVTFPTGANEGDVVKFVFLFDSLDSIWNYFEGWYFDDAVMTVEGEETLTELAVVDSGFVREGIAAGGGGMGYVTVENIGENEAKLKSYSWEGVDIAVTHEMGEEPPKKLGVGDQATFLVAVHVYAGVPDGSIAGLDFKIVYNSESGDPLEETVDIAIQWKFHGNDRSDYVHSQDALRHMRCLAYAIEDGIVTDGGELDSAIAAFWAGNYKAAKNLATKPQGVPGLGFYGLAPGQVQGNEGNGNGGLNGK
jgi:hypothetical protein